MRTWKKRLLLILVVLAALGGALFLRQMVALWQADCVVRISCTGLDNMFHLPYEYYALGRTGAIRVPESLARGTCGDFETQGYLHKNGGETAYWFAELVYAENADDFSTGTWTETDFGDQYRLFYHPWNPNTPQLSREDLALLRRAAEVLHSGDPTEWKWQGGGETGLVYFLLARGGDGRLLIQNDRYLLFPTEDGGFRRVMEVPKRGELDSVLFIQS